MKIDVYGSSKSGWSAHGEYEPGVDPPLASCPCRSKNITVSNTHTPYYTALCDDCGAEGPRVHEIGDRWRRRMSRAATEALHRAAFLAAITAWNRRSSLPR